MHPARIISRYTSQALCQLCARTTGLVETSASAATVESDAEADSEGAMVAVSAGSAACAGIPVGQSVGAGVFTRVAVGVAVR